MRDIYSCKLAVYDCQSNMTAPTANRHLAATRSESQRTAARRVVAPAYDHNHAYLRRETGSV